MAGSPPRWRRIAARAGIGILVALAVLAVVAWWLRDAPRRKVEGALAERLSADVDLGGLELDGLRSFVLRRLVVRRIAGQPRMERVEVDRLGVEGEVSAILEGTFERLDLDGVVVRIAPPDPDVPPPPEGPPTEVRVGSLALRSGKIEITDGRSETSIALTADLRGVGTALEGAIDLHAERLELAPLAPGLGGGLDGVAGTARISEGGSRAKVELRAERGTIERDGRSVPLEAPVLAVEGTLGDPIVAVEGHLDLTGIRSARLDARWDRSTSRLVSGSAAVEGIDLARWAMLPEGWSVEGAADAHATLPEGEPLAWKLEAALDRVVWPDGDAGKVAVRAEGSVDAANPSAGGPIHVSAKVAESSLAPSGTLPITLDLDGAVEGTSRLHGTATVRAADLATVHADGAAETADEGLRADVAFTLDPVAWRRVAPLLAGYGVSLSEGVSLDAELSATGKARWPEGIEARVEAKSLHGGYDPARLDEGAFSARLSWPGFAGPVTVSDLALTGRVAYPPLAPARFTIAGSAKVDPAPLAVRDARFRLSADGLAEATTEGSYDVSSGGKGHVTVRELSIAKWQAFLRPLTGDFAPGFSAEGTATAELDGTIRPDSTWTATGTAAVAKSGFSSDDGSRVLQGFDTTWKIAGDGDFAGKASLKADADVGGFQILWDAFYADYSALPSAMTVTAELNPAKDADRPAWKGGVEWAYPGGPKLTASLADARATGRTGYGVKLEVADLGETLRRYLREPLGDSVPFFSRIEGKGALRIEAGGILASEELSVSGRIRSDGLTLEGTKGTVEVAGLGLDLPFDLRWGKRSADGTRPLSGKEQTGTLRFDRLDLGGLEVAALETGLTIRTDSVRLEEPMALPLLDGILGFEKLTLTDFARPSRRLETAILVSKVDLATASKAFGLPPLSGYADAYLPKVVLTGPTFEVEGGGEIAVFGGKVTIGDISGQDMLTRFPKLHLNADFEKIDLAQVTKTFDFGDMTGLVSGYVHDVELFRSVPTRFDAKVATDEAGGLRNRINVKAVNNIAIFGTGGKIGLLDRGIHKFIDSFTYSRIGISLQLVNDVFLMRGLESRDGKELFVKGRLPFRIDVVNAQPGRTVSFRSMLDRLSDLDVSVSMGK